jgi:hypothetical protein
MTEQPIYADVAKDLGDDPLADRPDGVALHNAVVTLPTLASVPGDDEDDDDEPEACHGCGDTPHHLSTDGHCDGCVADGQDRAAAS